jgi:hypothetical protein
MAGENTLDGYTVTAPDPTDGPNLVSNPAPDPLYAPNLPTSDPENAGQFWNNNGVLSISAG